MYIKTFLNCHVSTMINKYGVSSVTTFSWAVTLKSFSTLLEKMCLVIIKFLRSYPIVLFLLGVLLLIYTFHLASSLGIGSAKFGTGCSGYVLTFVQIFLASRTFMVFSFESLVLNEINDVKF